MTNLKNKLETITNIVIIAVAIIFGIILIQKYLINPTTAANPPHLQPTIGKQVNLAGEDFSKQPKTLILALQTTCHFCNDSAPFYKRLIQAVQGKNIKLVAVFPTKVEESTAHLNELGLTGMEVKQSPLNDLQASGTPTLILANDKGEIINYWVGKLPADKEAEVINQLNS